METTNRTRAEIQAEIEKLQAEMDAAWPQKGDIVYLEATVNQVYDDMDGIVDVRIVGDGDVYPVYAHALIPAADLIPREEHERLVEEAVDKALNGDMAAEEKAYALGAMNVRVHVRNENDALDVLVKEYANYKPLDNSPTELEWAHDGQHYRVTVERLDADKPEPASDDQASANRLVEWYAANNREHKMTWSHEVNGRTYFVCVAPHDGTGYAPDATTAVAPKGVVEELRKAAHNLTIWYEQHMHDKATEAQLAGAREVLNAALSRITELPEPSEWARKWVVFNNPNIGGPGWNKKQCLDLAAALLESEADGE